MNDDLKGGRSVATDKAPAVGASASEPTIRQNPPAPASETLRADGRGFRLSTFRSLRYRDYRLLFFSIMFTSAGQWMEQIALSWMAYDMTNSPFMLGAINGMRAIPFLILGPWAGVAADRMSRKKLMILSQAWR